MEYGASAEDVARVCHAHPVRNIFILISLFIIIIILYSRLGQNH
jgi:hypothetical protein